MRRNGFGECYCHTLTEVCTLVDESAYHFQDLSVEDADISACADSGKWSVAVICNDDGETLCYIEADTRDKVLALVFALEIQIT